MAEPWFLKTRREIVAMRYRENGYMACRNCGKGCEWWISPNGKRILFDAMNDDDNAWAVAHQETCKGKKGSK